MLVNDVLRWLDGFAPFDSCEDFDNVGLLIGNGMKKVTGILFCMDATPEAVQTAADQQLNLIVSHHPLIFHPLRRVDTNLETGRSIELLLRGDIQLIAAHTNLDKAPGGISDSLADCLGLKQVTAADAYLRVGGLTRALSGEEFLSFCAEALRTPLRVYHAASRPISRVAVAGGAYGEGCALAASLGADAFVVGEVRHHELLEACPCGLTVVDAGHYATEWPGVEALYRRFRKEMPSSVPAELFRRLPFITDMTPYRPGHQT